MPQLEIPAKELTDVQVSHVSLVKRGAIRLPFRILKSEGDGIMINLTHLFKTDPAVPAIAAVIVNKAVDLEATKARLTKAGFQIETFDESQDGVIIFPQVDELPDVTPGKNGAYIVKMDESLSLILTGVEKAFEPINFDSTSFDEVLAQEGMRPGIHLSMDILGATVSNILAKVEDRPQMVTDLTKALDEFKNHIVDMAQAVPENAFSVDFFKAEIAPVAAPVQAAPAEGTPVAPITPAPTNAPVVETPAEAPAQVPVGDAPAGDPPAEGMEKVIGQMADLAKGITALTAATGKTQEQITALSTRVEDTATLAKSAADAADKVSNTVRGGAEGDPVDNAPVKKAVGEYQGGSNPPLMDTAYPSMNGAH